MSSASSNKKLSATIVIGGAVSGTLGRSTATAKRQMGDLGRTVRALTKEQGKLGDSIKRMTASGAHIGDLRQRYERLGAQIDRTRRAQDRLTAAAERHAKLTRAGAATMRAGAVTGAAGLGVVAGARTTLKEAIDRENVVTVIRNSGISKEDGDAMIAAAASIKHFGVTTTKATETVAELRTALGDSHHAIEALPIALKGLSGLRLYDRLHHGDLSEGDSAYQLAKVSEERGGAASPEAMRQKYNWAFKAITGSNGKVSVQDLLTSVRGGKGAVQAMSDEAFFGDTFLQQAMGAPQYGKAASTLVNAWIGGHQTHGAFQNMLNMGLLNRSGVKFDKIGKVKSVSSDALVDSQLFLKDQQAWVDKHLIPLAQKRGVKLDDPAQLMAFVNSISSNTNAANLVLSRMRFRDNIWKDRKNVMIAHDAEQSDQQNRQSTAGKQDEAAARLEDLKTRFGQNIAPTYIKFLETINGALEKVNRFAEQHPKLFGDLALGITGIGAAAVIAGPVLVTAGAAMQVIATIRLARASAEITQMVGAMGGVEAAAAGAKVGIGGVVGLLRRAAIVLGGAALIDAGAGALGVGKKKVDQAQDDANWNRMNWWQRLESGAARGVEGVGRFAFMGNIANDAQANRIKAETEYLGRSGQRGRTPPPPPERRSRVAPIQYHDNSTNTFSVTQQPGESGADFSKRLARDFANDQRKRAQANLFDQPAGF